MPVIENSRPSMIILPTGEHLSPGENDVSEESWKKSAATSFGKAYIKAGLLTVLEKDKATPMLDTIHTMSVRLAKEYVASEGNLVRMNRWYENEKRPTLRKLMLDRITALTAKAQQEKELLPGAKMV